MNTGKGVRGEIYQYSKKRKRTQSKVKVSRRERETDTEVLVGVEVVSWSADRSPEVVIYSIVSISQQQLQPSFFISFHSLRTARYFCPLEANRHSK